VTDSKILGLRQHEITSAGLGDDRIGERVLAALLETGGQPQYLVASEPVVTDDLQSSVRPESTCPSVDDQRVDRAQSLDGLGIAEQYTRLCARPVAT